MSPDESRERIRALVHGAMTNYINAHGMTLASTSNVNSLEKRIVGALWGALKTGQLSDGSTHGIDQGTVCSDGRVDG